MENPIDGNAGVAGQGQTQHQNPNDEEDPWSTVGGGAINERKRKNKADSPKASPSYSSSGSEASQPIESSSSKPTSNFDPLGVRSHLYHALEGLDRYPNYLSRWNHQLDTDEDLLRLEHALLEQAARVKKERERLREFRQTKILPIVEEMTSPDSSENHQSRFGDLLKPPTTWDEVKELLDPALSKAIFASRMWKQYEPNLSDVLSGKTDVILDVGPLTEIMDEESFDVFSIPLLRPEFCESVRSYVSTFLRIQQQKEKQNDNNNSNGDLASSSSSSSSLTKRPTDMDTVGLGWINDLIFHLVIKPISRHLFQSTETEQDLDWRQGYVAAYSAQPDSTKPRTNLVTHTDDSEVTLNICLSKEQDFEGGMIEFHGLRGTGEQGSLLGTYQHSQGRAIIHAGRHFHRVTPVTSGNRHVYIIWARSWQGSRAHSCPCCWLNRRKDNNCICGSKWN